MKKLIAMLICTIFAVSLIATVQAEPNISFKNPAYMLNVGAKLKLDINIDGINKKGLNIEYSSSDENIVAINKGQAIGVAEGKANIVCSATDKENNTYTAKCTISVIVPIKKISTEESSITLAAEPFGTESEKEQFKPYFEYAPKIKIEPEDASIKNLQWESQDPLVAHVSDDGTIRGSGFGKTVVTGTAKDGSKKAVKINVNVPIVYTSGDEIIIDTPKGKQLTYSFTSVNGFNMYSVGTKGDCFDYNVLSDSDGFSDDFSVVNIVPKKVGKGSMIFIRNGRVAKKVNIKVLDSAIEKEQEGGIRKEFKKSMDDYKAFMDKYVEFMNKYSESDSAISMLSDYASMMQDYEKMQKSFDAWDESELSKEELECYIDTQNYVSKKLLEVTN